MLCLVLVLGCLTSDKSFLQHCKSNGNFLGGGDGNAISAEEGENAGYEDNAMWDGVIPWATDACIVFSAKRSQPFSSRAALDMYLKHNRRKNLPPNLSTSQPAV